MENRHAPHMVLLSYLIMIAAIIVSSGVVLRALLLIFLFAYIAKERKLGLIRSLKGILAFSIVIFLMNALLFSKKDPIFFFWIFALTEEGVWQGVNIVYIIVSVTILSSLFLSMLKDREIADAFSVLLSPLGKAGLPAGELSMIMTLVFRFIPMIRKEGEDALCYEKIRSCNSGRRRFLPLLVPVFISSFRRAENLALAMDARGYKGEVHIEKTPSSGRDFLMVFIASLILAITILRRIIYG